MSRWLSALFAWCFVFLLALEHTTNKPVRQRTYALCATLMLAILIAFAISTQVSAGELLTDGMRVRVQLNATEPEWLEGKVRTIEGCRYVMLITPTRDGYTSLMLNGAARLQANKTSRWLEVSLREAINTEPLKCREMGAD